jgi:hypothetical protein
MKIEEENTTIKVRKGTPKPIKKWICKDCEKVMYKLKYVPFNALGMLGVCFYCRSKNLKYIGDDLK